MHSIVHEDDVQVVEHALRLSLCAFRNYIDAASRAHFCAAPREIAPDMSIFEVFLGVRVLGERLVSFRG